MELAVGEVLSGKVTGITKFGAFVSLPQGKTGLVHISEVDQSYVNDIHDHLSEGQEVKVKIIAIDEGGRVNLSIRKAQAQQAGRRSAQQHGGAQRQQQHRSSGGKRTQSRASSQHSNEPLSFEDKLKHFMQDSESRMADIRRNTDKKNGARRRR